MKRAALILMAAVLAAIAPAASAATDVQAIAVLNSMRAQVGIDPVSIDPAMSEGCRKHVAYMRGTGHLSHNENPGPFTTTEGMTAGAYSVIAGKWWDQPDPERYGMDSVEHSPWQPMAGPRHFFQVMHPALKRTGYADDAAYACLTTIDPRGLDHDEAAGKSFVWPADGQTGVPYKANTKDEQPSESGALGLDPNADTGPYLFVWAQGLTGPEVPCPGFRTPTDVSDLGTTFSEVSITGPSGAVPLRYADGSGLSTYSQSCTATGGGGGKGSGDPVRGGWIVAEKPLQPSTTYTASVLVTGIGPSPISVRKTWTFTTMAKIIEPIDETTGDEDPAATPPSLALTATAKANVVRRYKRVCASGRCTRQLVPVVQVSITGKVRCKGVACVRPITLHRLDKKGRATPLGRTTSPRGAYKRTITLQVPAAQRGRALAWYRSTWPRVAVRAGSGPSSVRQLVRVGQSA